MKLILDFDDVLFNTKGLKDGMFEVLREEGVMNATSLYEAERASGRVFVTKEFFRNACATLLEDGDTLVELDVDSMYERFMNVCPGLINQELVDVIYSVGKENCYIVSNGDEAFQMDKIVRAGAHTLVKSVTIVPGSKKQVIEKICADFPDEEIIFLDDKTIYFDDLNKEACTNLTTIIYDENGFQKLTQKMEAIKNIEGVKLGELQGHPQSSMGPKIR